MKFVEEKVPIKVHNYAVDSRHRNRELYPSESQYVINIPTPFKNVVKVELVSAVYEKFGTENYLNVHIDELGGNLESNNNDIVGIFTQLPLIHPLNLYSSQQFKSVKVFERPLAKLGRMSISFRSFDGSLYPMLDHLLRFEIHCCKDESCLQSRGGGLDLFSEYASVYVPENINNFAPPATPMSMPTKSPLFGENARKASVIEPPSVATHLSPFGPSGGKTTGTSVNARRPAAPSTYTAAPAYNHNHNHNRNHAGAILSPPFFPK